MGELVVLPDVERRWLRVAELARRLGVSVRTVERWRAAGCPCLSSGGMLRFRQGEVEEWLRSR